MSAITAIRPHHSLQSATRSSWRILAVLTLAFLAPCLPMQGMAAVDRSQTIWQVAEIYVATLGYAPDNDGLQYWRRNIDTDPAWTATTVAQSFFDQPLVQAVYPPGQGYDALIEALYLNIFGRAADTSGKNYWLGQLQSGAVTRNAMIIALINGGWDNPEAANDMLRFGNRIEVALAFAAKQQEQGISYNALPEAKQAQLREAGRQVLANVTADAATRDTAIAGIDALLQSLGGDNQAPVAQSVSQSSNEGIVYVEAQLIGSDPDGDQITYNLVSPRSGSGYAEAYVGASSGRLYVTLDGSGSNVALSYNVSDGIVYSNTATATFQIVTRTEDRGTGAEEIDPQTYGGFDISTPWGNLLGAPGSGPTLPSSVDLTPSFPTPGDQGQQGSCVGWATAYAIKSYFEKRDMGWDLSRREHVFSPAFVFNAIALPGCNGSYFNQALDRMKDVGAATWDKMPYTDQECTSQPSTSANAQAPSYRIQSWGTLRTVDDMKAQLANHRPVLLGIQVYPAFNRLSGSSAVYNDFSGSSGGGHAVAIVGYDDNSYGGAFKVINSWGTGWGDQGFFWFPYSGVSNPNVFMGAYSIEDITNTEPPVDPDDPVDPDPIPPPSDDLPNLEILNWTATYDPRPGGEGSLEFEIVNSGQSIAEAGAYVNLMLSKDTAIGSDDVFVVYEPIPFDLEPGTIAYRDAAEGNALSFYLPDTLEAGIYQMALWIDDLDSVRESNEDDNISFGDPVSIENSLPDLVVENWYAEWGYGSGELSYEVMNQGVGTANGGWDVNLMLSTDEQLGNSDDIYVAFETVTFSLAQYEYVYRDWLDPLYFTVDDVEPGVYFMALWIDDLDQVIESNERNNESWGWSPVYFGYDAWNSTTEPAAAQVRQDESGGVQHNGRRQPLRDAKLMQVQISETSGGERALVILGEANGLIQGAGTPWPSKVNEARNKRLFPKRQSVAMPTVTQ